VPRRSPTGRRRGRRSDSTLVRVGQQCGSTTQVAPLELFAGPARVRAAVETSAEEAERAEAVGGPLFDQRLAERVKWLADDARVATFERLGENLRAAAIMERRLTGVA
jgi:hypothetical protein